MMHKPEPMHTGICPSCRRRKVCVLLKPSGTTKRRYYVRKHECGQRMVPTQLQILRTSPELVGAK